MKSKDYWVISEGDEIEFQRASRPDVERARVTEVGTILGSVYFGTESGRIFYLSDLAAFRNISLGNLPIERSVS